MFQNVLELGQCHGVNHQTEAEHPERVCPLILLATKRKGIIYISTQIGKRFCLPQLPFLFGIFHHMAHASMGNK